MLLLLKDPAKCDSASPVRSAHSILACWSASHFETCYIHDVYEGTGNLRLFPSILHYFGGPEIV